MANLNQVKTQIEFQLEKLGAQNAHHEFEHLCRFLTRNRICSNVLPATGPVSKGGDQGRDFETYRSYLSSSPIATTSFLGLVKDKVIVFACSIQKKGIRSKIKDDVKTILKGGEVDEVHFFGIVPITVSERHTLQTWADEKFNIHLEIYDSEAISEMLVDRDVFWIAIEYLHIPSEIYPQYDENNWYLESKQIWLTHTSDFEDINYADFTAIRFSARYAFNNEESSHDLFEWIRLLISIEKIVEINYLKRKIVYEIVFLSCMGLKKLDGLEPLIQIYLDKIPILSDPTDFEDASIIINLSIFGLSQHQINFAPEQIQIWKQQLIDVVDEQLLIRENINTRCHLLEVKGSLSISEDENKVIFEAAIKYWEEVLSLVKKAGMYPLQKFALTLSRYIELLPVSHELLAFSSKVDKVVQERMGIHAAADFVRNRAHSLMKKGEYILAIRELHKAKISWMSPETIRGAFLTSMVLAVCYKKIGLYFASKYCALSASYIAVNDNTLELQIDAPRAIIFAAEIDYLIGAWLNFVNLVDAFYVSQSMFVSSPFDIDEHKELNQIIFYLVMIKVLSEKIAPNYIKGLKKKLEPFFEDEFVKEAYTQANKTWKKIPIEEVWKRIENSLGSAPYSDIGSKREYKWKALGVDWYVTWPNEYEANSLAEQFISMVQIVQADIADDDYCLIPTSVNIIIEINHDKEYSFESIPQIDSFKYIVNITTQKGEEGLINMFASITTILEEISLLPQDDIDNKVENLLANGITGKLTWGAFYSKIIKGYVPESKFMEGVGGEKIVIKHNLVFPITEHSKLKWIDSLGPTYSEKESKELLENRYSTLIPLVQNLINDLKIHDDFLLNIAEIKSMGWLDWQIFGGIYAISTNYLTNMEISKRVRLGEKLTADLHKDLFQKYTKHSSQFAGKDFPYEIFSEKNIGSQLLMNMISSIRIYGLEMRQQAPDFQAIGKFMGKRYRYFIDDVEHEELFT